MREIKKLVQDSELLHKRWFSSADVDLYVWLNSNNTIERFQLCYDKFINEHAFAWSESDGYNHYVVSDGEEFAELSAKTSPILLDNYEKKIFPKNKLLMFLKAHQDIDAALFNFVINKVNDCPFDQAWYLYMIRTEDNALYTGITTDVERRLEEHQSNNYKSAKYFRGKENIRLVFRHELKSRSEASYFEARVKKLSKAKKEMLVSGEISLMNIEGVR